MTPNDPFAAVLELLKSLAGSNREADKVSSPDPKAEKPPVVVVAPPSQSADKPQSAEAKNTTGAAPSSTPLAAQAAGPKPGDFQPLGNVVPLMPAVLPSQVASQIMLGGSPNILGGLDLAGGAQREEQRAVSAGAKSKSAQGGSGGMSGGTNLANTISGKGTSGAMGDVISLFASMF